jgi:amidophosphoribosyltransferase
MHKDMGLVAQVFHEENLRPLQGHLAIGHNRYSTTGSSHIRNAQPHLIETMHGPLGVGHNGNLTNALTLRRQLARTGRRAELDERQRGHHPDAGRAAAWR